MSRTESRLPPLAPSLVAAIEAACASVATRATDRLASAHDASHYLLTPQLVAAPATAEEVVALFAASRDQMTPMTFRSGGTSLSGQAGTAGILVDSRRNFRTIEVLEDGLRVRTGPGATVRAVNARLARHGRKLGPDPASEIACTVGGVVNNNSCWDELRDPRQHLPNLGLRRPCAAQRHDHRHRIRRR